MKLKLTEAQASAMECRDWSMEPTVQECWDGDRLLTFEEHQRAELFSEINEAANAEDAQAEMRSEPPETRRGCRGAATALTNLAFKI